MISDSAASPRRKRPRFPGRDHLRPRRISRPIRGGTASAVDPSLRVGTLGERLAQRLRERIIRGDLAGGERLVEDAVAAEFDISRGPVRDAFRVLESEGLVTPLRRGVSVRGFSEQDVEEVYSLRRANEQLAARLQAARAPEASFDRMTEGVTVMARAADRDEWQDFATYDLDFHTEVYAQCGHRRLVTIWRMVLPVFEVMLDLTNQQDLDL